MTYQTEFPDFDPSAMPVIPQGFTDISWHNDSCPSFQRGDMTLFVDYADPTLREWEDSKRFALQADGVTLTDSADWRVILQAIDFRDTFKAGADVTLSQLVDRWAEGAYVPQGETGIIVECTLEVIRVRLHKVYPELAEWDNCLEWYPTNNPESFDEFLSSIVLAA